MTPKFQFSENGGNKNANVESSDVKVDGDIITISAKVKVDTDAVSSSDLSRSKYTELIIENNILNTYISLGFIDPNNYT